MNTVLDPAPLEEVEREGSKVWVDFRREETLKVHFPSEYK